jgi:hypothetical protein
MVNSIIAIRPKSEGVSNLPRINMVKKPSNLMLMVEAEVQTTLQIAFDLSDKLVPFN